MRAQQLAPLPSHPPRPPPERLRRQSLCAGTLQRGEARDALPRRIQPAILLLEDGRVASLLARAVASAVVVDVVVVPGARDSVHEQALVLVPIRRVLQEVVELSRLGGLRGLGFYMQRTALQGYKPVLEKIAKLGRPSV